MKAPNVTPAQVGALVTALGGQAVAFGLLTGSREQTIVAAVTAAIAIAWKLADAIIRNGRSRALHGVQAAAITQEATLDPITQPAPTEAVSAPLTQVTAAPPT